MEYDTTTKGIDLSHFYFEFLHLEDGVNYLVFEKLGCNYH